MRVSRVLTPPSSWPNPGSWYSGMGQWGPGCGDRGGWCASVVGANGESGGGGGELQVHRFLPRAWGIGIGIGIRTSADVALVLGSKLTPDLCMTVPLLAAYHQDKNAVTDMLRLATPDARSAPPQQRDPHHHRLFPDALGGHSTPAGGPSPTTIPADLLAHHQHLESLLDSALATLALIHSTSTVTTNGVIPYNSHMVQVTQALARHITPCSDHTPTLLSTPTIHQRLDHAPVPATYATVAAAHPKRSPSASPTIPVPNMMQQSRHAPVVLTHEHPRGTRVIVRFDLTPSQPPDRAAPISLHGAIDEVLPDAGLSGVRWTKGGNLVLVPGRHFCTGKFLFHQRKKIWMAIRPLLGLPGDYKCPAFESDERWHSVVFHGVPASVTDAPIDLESIRAWLDLDDVQGSLKAFSILRICRRGRSWPFGFLSHLKRMPGDSSKTVVASTAPSAGSPITLQNPVLPHHSDNPHDAAPSRFLPPFSI
ncbi:hypothetical protein DFH07DRAFT_944973 [Mycena maculata]|uniref:Uncharacterized protein n=1 Tax=Mycena maculata TaxID=230809 RepID=A0AAD7MVQ9_9AGAR|nr:hypothetical protein DFH07DRAFT_944973 [Mycena maculata]